MSIIDTRGISTARTSVPNGDYELMVTKAELVVKENHKAVSLEFAFVDKKQKVWDYIIYEYPAKTQVQDIGRRKLAALCMSAFYEKLVIEDVTIFLQKSVFVNLVNEEYNGDMKLKVKFYMEKGEYMDRQMSDHIREKQKNTLAPKAASPRATIHQSYTAIDEDVPF